MHAIKFWHRSLTNIFGEFVTSIGLLSSHASIPPNTCNPASSCTPGAGSTSIPNSLNSSAGVVVPSFNCFSVPANLGSMYRSKISSPPSSFRTTSTYSCVPSPSDLCPGPFAPPGFGPGKIHSPTPATSGHSRYTHHTPAASTATHSINQFLAPAPSTTMYRVHGYSAPCPPSRSHGSFICGTTFQSPNFGNTVIALFCGTP